MELLLSNLVTMVANLLVFSFIPFLWWFFRHRKETGFFRWIGFIVPKLTTKWWTLLIFLAVYIFFYKFDFTVLISQKTMDALESSSSVAASKYAGLGFAAIIPAFIENFIANGVAEEILFRGFLCKRLCSKFGTVAGIISQGVLFGLMHNILILLAGVPVDFTYHILVFTFTGMGALLLGYLNEKIYNGSIAPSIFLHGLGNFLTTIGKAF